MGRRLEIGASESVISFLSKARALRTVVAMCAALLTLPGGLTTPTIAAAQSQSLADFTILDPPGAFSTQIVLVNDSGDAALDGIDSNANLLHFLYSQGNFSKIKFGSIFARVMGFNNSGQILFRGGDLTGHGRSVLVNPGVDRICGPPTDNVAATVYALNNSGQVAGTYYTAAGAARLFVYSAGTYTTFDAPVRIATPGGIAIGGINASGQVAGWVGTKGFVLSGGSYTTFDIPLFGGTGFLRHCRN